jgi:membrane-associated phospholipid phosphatase
MAFGLAVYFFATKSLIGKTKKIFSYRGVFFIVASIVMSLARVGVGVHWPTDIVAGWIV